MKRILIIEDDPEIAHLLQLELGEAGYTVDWASGGMSGLVRLREAVPDLVILDLGLPDLDGGEVARRIRAGYEVPIIVLTAADAVERKVSLLSDGADDYIVKPFHPAELLACKLPPAAWILPWPCAVADLRLAIEQVLLFHRPATA